MANKFDAVVEYMKCFPEKAPMEVAEHFGLDVNQVYNIRKRKDFAPINNRGRKKPRGFNYMSPRDRSHCVKLCEYLGWFLYGRNTEVIS